MHDDIPMPPSHGCIVFQTPNDPSRIFCPIPNSIKNSGIPSSISITANGIKNAPNEMKLTKFYTNTVMISSEVFRLPQKQQQNKHCSAAAAMNFNHNSPPPFC